jgi:hypothetical protein
VSNVEIVIEKNSATAADTPGARHPLDEKTEGLWTQDAAAHSTINDITPLQDKSLCLLW